MMMDFFPISLPTRCPDASPTQIEAWCRAWSEWITSETGMPVSVIPTVSSLPVSERGWGDLWLAHEQVYGADIKPTSGEVVNWCASRVHRLTRTREQFEAVASGTPIRDLPEHDG